MSSSHRFRAASRAGILVWLVLTLLLVSCRPSGSGTNTPVPVPPTILIEIPSPVPPTGVIVTTEPNPILPITPGPTLTLTPTLTPTLTLTPEPTVTLTPEPTFSPTPRALPTPIPEPTQAPTQEPTPAPSPPVDAGPSVFGVELYRLDKAGGLPRAARAGAHWIRIDAFNWDRIEPKRTDPPTYLWETVDEAGLQRAAARGLEVIATVRFAPAWAQEQPGQFCGPLRKDALEAFAQFLRALVARYGAPPYSIRYWEMGNEPDIDSELVGGRNLYGCWGDVEDEYYGGGAYAEMLKRAYPAIKGADPAAEVVLGSLLLDCDPRDPTGCWDKPHGAKSLRFLEGILKNDGGRFFDVLGFHAYAYYGGLPGTMGNGTWPGSVTAIPEKVAFLRQILQKYNVGEKPLMNTESALLCKEPWAECLETQAMYVPRAYAEALAMGLEAQIHYAMISEHWWHSGLLLLDLTPKPAYHAYRAAALFLGAAVYQGEAQGYPAGVMGYTFYAVDAGHWVDVLWTVDGTGRRIDVPHGSHVYDHFGSLLADVGEATINFRPVYVTRP